MKLTHANLDTIVRDCLFRDEELVNLPQNTIPEGIKVEGVVHTFVLHRERLEAHRQDVKSMLEQLDDAFFADKGGGMSLIQMPFTKEGKQWGEQPDADVLYILGNALGYCRWCLPREMWSVLPGGLPYVEINLKKEIYDRK